MATGVGGTVGAGVADGVGFGVCVGADVGVEVGVGVLDGVRVGVAAGVAGTVAVAEGEALGVGVFEGVTDTVPVGWGVAVGEGDTEPVGVGVSVGVCVPSAGTISTRWTLENTAPALAGFRATRARVTVSVCGISIRSDVLDRITIGTRTAGFITAVPAAKR